MFDTPYQKYLKSTCSDVSRVHKGYFSIDKKTGRSVDSKANKEGFDEKDVSAYDLILKNKERLLSFDEPTRFIFSHSALREGWDNPNVFQICTLKHSDSNTAKRQEVGRGLRLCVNQDGNRIDVQSCGDSVHEIAETKGTMESLELRPIEQAKISCAKKLFNEMSTSNVVYHDVDSYQSLLNIMNSL